MSQKAPEDEKYQLDGSALAKLDEHGSIESETNPDAELTSEPPRKNWRSGGLNLFIGVGLGIALAFMGMRFVSPSQTTETSAQVPARETSQPGRSVTVAEVTSSRLDRAIAATGTVAAWEMTPVSPQATGLKIESILADEGDFVKTGQVMAILDDSLLQASLAEAKAAVAQAEARLAELRAGSRSEEIARARENLRSAEAAVASAEAKLELAQTRVERNRILADAGAIARDRFDEILNEERSNQLSLEQAKARRDEAQQQLAEVEKGPRQEVIAAAEAEVARAEAQVQSVLEQLDDTRVVAPVNGEVAERNARLGDVTSGSQPLFKLIENGRLELILKVPETQLTQISPGQPVKITSDSDRDLQVTGEVREIYPTVDENSRQAQVKINLPATENLRPGMFLRAEIITQSTSGLTVPYDAIQPQSENTAIVFVVQADNSVAAKEVTIGTIMPEKEVEIKSGLNSGERVVVKGAAYLKDGDKIEIVATE
ncbi:efflux RND transporter periplasmic adaptor subunit [Oscillatoria salina]|uniref:efflux RND transporter periplasmic adaptor subunit n=1 Tax=Oscillatoria salina TaxID=331517 RepID=UPI001CCB0DC4|nr:efflux RND transporter periplasmic adaptor subunit [Oscillatoria salina]MBZ8179570.1 efflux RND transporter periplasmic adaptor subunit [Oscillatoria salina IIICB1]